MASLKGSRSLAGSSKQLLGSSLCLLRRAPLRGASLGMRELRLNPTPRVFTEGILKGRTYDRTYP